MRNIKYSRMLIIALVVMTLAALGLLAGRSGVALGLHHDGQHQNGQHRNGQHQNGQHAGDSQPSSAFNPKPPAAPATIRVNTTIRHQKMEGFGATTL